MNRKNGALIISLIISAAILVSDVTIMKGNGHGMKEVNLFIISVSLFIPMVSYGAFDYVEFQRNYSAERRLPDLLRDLSNYTSFGVPLSEAFQRINRNTYGMLTSGVRRVSSLLSAGVIFEEAISHLGHGLQSSRIAMVSKILQKSNESGSNTSDVVWILSDFTSRSELLRESRAGEMKNYDLVMIISFAVFVFVIIFLDIRFIDTMLRNTTSSGSFINSQLSGLDIERAFSVGVIVQALAIGMISGILRDVRMRSGVLLAGILLAVTTAVFVITGVY